MFLYHDFVTHIISAVRRARNWIFIFMFMKSKVCVSERGIGFELYGEM